jgi:hypothetical protein
MFCRNKSSVLAIPWYGGLHHSQFWFTSVCLDCIYWDVVELFMTSMKVSEHRIQCKNTGGAKKKYDSLIYYNLKSKRVITLKLVTVYYFTMFNLNFDRCLVPFHAILTEITVFKLKQTFLEPPRISWKGPIKTIYHFLAIIVSISRLVWRGQLFWVHTLLGQISTRESISNCLGQVYVCVKWSTIWESFVKRLLYSMPQLETANDPKFFRLYDFTGKTLHSCWGTCIYWSI